MTAYERIDQFQWRAAGIGPWLRQIAVNKVRDLHRTRGRHERLQGVYQDQLAVLRGHDDSPTGQAADPEMRVAWAQERELARTRIEQTLKVLNPRYARAIRLRLMEGSSREQCAEELEVTVATFDVVLYRAIRAFRKAWGPERGGPMRRWFPANPEDGGGPSGQDVSPDGSVDAPADAAEARAAAALRDGLQSPDAGIGEVEGADEIQALLATARLVRDLGGGRSGARGSGRAHPQATGEGDRRRCRETPARRWRRFPATAVGRRSSPWRRCFSSP